MSATLAAIATSLETHAGASTSANANESGYWKRIAAAAEALAGASTTANAHVIGYMKRAAVALESIAGTGGAEENANESGYKKRIVDALEVQAGAVTVGSLDSRMMVAAENAGFGEEVWPQPEFDASVGLEFDVLAPPVVAGGVLTFGGGEVGEVWCRSSTVPEAGNYDFVIKVDSIFLTSLDIKQAPGGAALYTPAGVGTFTGIIALDGINKVGLFDDLDRSGAVVDHFSLIGPK